MQSAKKKKKSSIPLFFLSLDRYLENPEACLDKERADDLGKDIRGRIRNITGTMEVADRRRLEDVMARLDQAMNGTSSPRFSPLRLYDAAARRDDDKEEEEDGADCFTWNYYNSVFFCFTAVTTIGERTV